MNKLASEFVGTGGTFYVMARLAFEGFHAGLTYGNAQNVDILVASPDGSRALSIQVKTAWKARRDRGRDGCRAPHHLEWTLGRKAAKIRHDNFFFAFVDLRKLRKDKIPDVYIVPAVVVAKHCEGWVDKAKMVRFHPSIEMMEPYKNNWQLLRDALSEGTAVHPNETALLSEEALAADWSRPEEEAAWSHLQPGK
ncbi:MAG TPA: hypothetical protein VIL46_15075 [Gemmataceae bacterium]